jgi:hypothetical protein
MKHINVFERLTHLEQRSGSGTVGELGLDGDRVQVQHFAAFCPLGRWELGAECRHAAAFLGRTSAEKSAQERRLVCREK